MRIALITTTFPSLSQTFVLNQIIGLLEMGCDVRVFSLYLGEDKIHPDVLKYDLLNRTTYINSPNTAPKRLRKFISWTLQKGHCFPYALLHTLNLIKFKEHPFTLSRFFRLLPFLETDSFDVIHCHFGITGSLISDIVDYIPHRIFITSFYGYDVTSRYGIKSLPFHRLIRKGDAFLPLCKNMSHDLLALGFPENKIIIHPLGIEFRKFSFGKQNFHKNKMLNILTVARLVEKKGLRFALEALSKVLEKANLPVIYRIVGDGPLKESLSKLTRDLGLQNYVQFVGWKTQEEVIEYFKNADLFLLPSIMAEDGDQEGTPTVLLEAQAMEIPVISTLHSGIPEIVDNGVSGFLVPEKDSDAIADKILYLIDHTDRLQAMGKCGRKFVERHFDVRKLNKKLINIYNQLI